MTFHTRLHGQLLLLATAYFAGTFGRFTLGPLQETLRINLALSDTQIALLQGPAVAVPMALGAIPIGLLVDRSSRVRVLLVAVAFMVSATVLSGLASSLPSLVVARALAGLSSAAIVVAAYSMLCDLYPAGQRGRANMVVTMGDVMAPSAAFALGGVLLGLSSSGSEAPDWRWAVLWMAAPLVVALILLVMIREPARSDVEEQKAPLSHVWSQLWRYRWLIVPLLIARIMVWIADGAVLVWAAPNFERHFGLAPDKVASIMATVLLFSAVLGPLLGGPLADLGQKTGGPRRTMAVLCVVAVLSVPASLFSIMPQASLSAIALGAFLTLGFAISTAAVVVGTIVIPGELRGVYVATTITVGMLFAYGLAPVTVSSVSIALGGELDKALAMVCALMSAVGAIAFGLAGRYFPHRIPTSDASRAPLGVPGG